MNIVLHAAAAVDNARRHAHCRFRRYFHVYELASVTHPAVPGPGPVPAGDGFVVSYGEDCSD